MKKFVAVLLVLAMVLAVTGSALAACKFEKGDLAELKKDTNAYSAARSSKKTKDVARAGSVVEVVRECGDYVKAIVNHAAGTTVYFKKCDLKPYKGVKFEASVAWAKGGTGMSTCDKSSIGKIFPEIKGLYVKVSGKTELRKNPGLKCKGQATVKKGTLLKLAGHYGFDDRGVEWFEVCHKGKKLWLSHNFIRTQKNGVTMKYYDKDGNCVTPAFE